MAIDVNSCINFTGHINLILPPRKKEDVSDEQHNPKVFTFYSTVKAKKLQARATEKGQMKLHVPTIDRSTGEPAPYVIVVKGPPKVGKSLINKYLVRHYTKLNLPEVRGPITIVSGLPQLLGIRAVKMGLALDASPARYQGLFGLLFCKSIYN